MSTFLYFNCKWCNPTSHIVEEETESVEAESPADLSELSTFDNNAVEDHIKQVIVEETEAVETEDPKRASKPCLINFICDNKIQCRIKDVQPKRKPSTKKEKNEDELYEPIIKTKATHSPTGNKNRRLLLKIPMDVLTPTWHQPHPLIKNMKKESKIAQRKEEEVD